jgi:sporulation protein YlmC with PRC-barrel domain
MNNEIINTDVDTVGRLSSRVLSASSLSDDDVYNLAGEKLGSIKEIMMDINTGRVCYVVLSFGGFLSMGEKLFAVPWSALKVDTENKRFLMDTNEERLKEAPGFDTDNWPNMADPTWEKKVHSYYGTQSNTTF